MAASLSTPARAGERTRPHYRRNRKDVLGLADAGETGHPTLLQAFQKLAQAGFNVNQTAPTHWIIRGRTPLPEFHCYSELELQQFTANRT